VDDLHGDAQAGGRVLRLVHLAHPAFAKEVADQVLAAEHAADQSAETLDADDGSEKILERRSVE